MVVPVHFVTAELDAGQSIAQSVIQVSLQDNVESLAQRVHQLEHFIYPQVAQWLCNGQLTGEKNGIRKSQFSLLNFKAIRNLIKSN